MITKTRTGDILVNPLPNKLITAHVQQIVATWAFLMERNESLTLVELSDRIANTYDIHNQRTWFDVQFLRRVEQNG
jgi:hypothetical protein